MVSDLRNCEMVVERTGKVIQQQMAERDALIVQWKEAVQMLQQRDRDMVKAQELIVTTHEMLETSKETLEEESEFLRKEQQNNRDIENEIQNLNMYNSKLRLELNELSKHVLLLNSELNRLKRDVVVNSHHLENERIKGKQIDQATANKEMLCIKYQEDTENLQHKLEEMKGSCESSEDKLKRIEGMIETEEKHYNIYVLDTEKLNTVLFLSDRTLKEQIEIEKKMQVNINNATCNCAHLRKHILNQVKELNKLKEVVYDMEFRIDDYEQKLVKIEKEKKQDADSEEKTKYIQELEQTLADHKDVLHTVHNQVDRLEKEMHRLSSDISTDKEQQDILQDKCEQHLLVFEISKKHIAAAKQKTQEKQVEENMMRLRINQIEKDMKKEDKQIYSLEKLRLNLDQAMKERQLEINMKGMVLHSKRRNLEEDKGRLRADIGLRRLKIEQLQKKYHIVLMSFGKDEDGQPLSVTHIKIKNAQEKFMLQQEGDRLDQKIKTTEQEIIAMENALKLVNLTNSSFKNSLAPVKDDDQEAQEMRELEENLKEINTVLKEFKKMLATKQEYLEEAMNKFGEAEERKGSIKEVMANLEEDIEVVQKQEYDKAEKLKRANAILRGY
ncbi:hypothetical protein NQ317_017679 [Molorchus minor]|uniref:Coiled-coil domain-containing protein 39 n=1 Tax=Molorchus minor TaxID=1323400 RepID=A0ABQ9JMT0_9CUCU|nr:hypothetical protein NQ317_017679 [Molorchus minor]